MRDIVDWTIIAALATAAGTLILAAATFASVRSARRAALATERALLASIRPVLVSSRGEDPPEKVGFVDDHWVRVEGGRGAAEATDDAVYIAISLRNVGNGLAILDRWDFHTGRVFDELSPTDVDKFRRLTRDIYVPAGEVGFWQGAFRDRNEAEFDDARKAVIGRQPMTIDLLYGDHEGGQHTVTRFVLVPPEDKGWIAVTARHWHLDQGSPR